MGQNQSASQNMLSVCRKAIFNTNLDGLEYTFKLFNEQNKVLPQHDEYGLTIYHHLALFASYYASRDCAKLSELVRRYRSVISPPAPLEKDVSVEYYSFTGCVMNVGISSCRHPFRKISFTKGVTARSMIAYFLSIIPESEFKNGTVKSLKAMSRIIEWAERSERIEGDERSERIEGRSERIEGRSERIEGDERAERIEGDKGRAERKVLEEYSNARCVICLTNPRAMLMMPCRHLCLCEECVDKIAVNIACPLCRENVTETIKVFM